MPRVAFFVYKFVEIGRKEGGDRCGDGYDEGYGEGIERVR
jgi:hypothetical protein